MTKCKVDIVYALPDKQSIVSFYVGQLTTIEEAIRQSGLLEQYKDIDLAKNLVGVFGRLAALTDQVNSGDRIEIYRPLPNDPKELRRKRAEKTKRK